ncbi:MAG TPA: Asp-tRNA(Asn)/Glu-tRNA(Gln) amidotransferase subunit GatA [Saprospiraceae bacterium]|nr:Asp-tRNA(Asn)/Glu-tRNA(Gln) amidotransferase subunit GatA [Saprospiraceae bacterium]HND88805.1 Asp-tRNA(Asn)/Glu-tRNA(Gln) amidotransferase subunit GatA [Saprospiraceae bacterium]
MSLPEPIFDLQQDVRQGKTSCIAIVERHLSCIEHTRCHKAYIEVWADEARERAKTLDQKALTQPDQLGRLFGVVVSLKDNICYAGHQVTAASEILQGFISLYSATAVERLLAEDAILIGRTNCDQFGMGSSNENSCYGPVQHPLDAARVSGGSSGGAAVSLATGTCTVAIGSDTGGSVRQPAGFCGVYGFKPTYGRISRHGLIAYGSSFDQIGIMAHHADDLLRVLEVMEGPDGHDATVSNMPQQQPSPCGKQYRLAYIGDTLEHSSMDAGVKKVTQDFIATLRTHGHDASSATFDLLDYIIPAYYVLTTAEASSNLARFDGVRYGYRHPSVRNLQETYLKSRTAGFSTEVKRRILLGTFVLSSGYYDAYYTKAQQVRRLIRDRLMEIFETHDFILLPVAPTTAWRFEEKSDDPVAAYLSDVFTVLANLAGLPAMSIPAGHHPDDGMPIGVQLMGRPGSDYELLAFASALQGKRKG